MSDLLAGAEKAQWLRISASGQRISAQGFDLSALANEQRAKGDEAEAEQYGLALGLATQNERFTAQSTAIQQYQLDRQLTQSLGTTRADVARFGGRFLEYNLKIVTRVFLEKIEMISVKTCQFLQRNR